MSVIRTREQRVQRVCDYIERHLDDDLSLDLLSDIAACSKYHFHRVFKASIGISTIQYLLLARLRRASFRLAFEPQKTVTDIALEARFDSPEAFSRAFSRTLGQTPSQFRSQPDWPTWHSRLEIHPIKTGDMNLDVRIIDFPRTQIAFITHQGDHQRVLETASKLIEWRKQTGLSPVKTSQTFGIPYSDPNDTPKEAFRFDIAGSVLQDVPENEFGVENGVIPPGRCAVIQHKGSHDGISDTVYHLYRKWLPDSGEELRDFPCFFHYLNLIHEVDECDLITDIYLPIR
ncbi:MULTISPECIES: AraC family transcriptional regulator [unclassified Vibrio]|uniref:AraC family transcriptional regulator n=1 Tax=unclassified Vibrio TaxID=2614977 RepID=UPI001361CAC3|nr:MULTISPECIES: AraC family transcriptional regulator [unclassified Vibrio]NAW57923.1 helix-turn-helix domain-containing protein [Vibrio sp. V36_P2S2PM302]NAX26881.1 helix-turn-helix domain-containing protein [Vibrio sp. V38_P2S17PM301]NAX29252.1 helix-turn-helix domain-containing protein [Vibrio sp. V37_P2S8PM304]